MTTVYQYFVFYPTPDLYKSNKYCIDFRWKKLLEIRLLWPTTTQNLYYKPYYRTTWV